ncbi:MAG: hypothetical protein V4689_11645 [Verrucomicrobiota bacterium]
MIKRADIPERNIKWNPFSLLATLVLILSTFAPAAEILPWPTGAEALVDKAISIKQKAQKQNMTMRTKGGVAGIEFAKCIDDLAVALTDAKIEPKLLEAEGSDVKAKIALWALDRKRRADEYGRFAERHVNAPEGKETLERFYGRRVGEGAPYPRFLNPQPVSKEKAVEANRWIIEYLYFAPPTGREFVEHPGRYVLGEALGEIRNEKSLVFLKFDLEIQIEAFPDALPGQGGGSIGGSAVQVLDFRTVEAFKITASLIHHPGVRTRVQEEFSYLSRPHYPEQYSLLKLRVDDYKKLADLEWQTDAEKELASWIKAIPPMAPPER